MFTHLFGNQNNSAVTTARCTNKQKNGSDDALDSESVGASSFGGVISTCAVKRVFGATELCSTTLFVLVASANCHSTSANAMKLYTPR